MSTPTEILEGPMAKARTLLPTLPWSGDVCVLLLAIGLQESGLTFRRQMGNGPARGLWQFEAGGGVKGVMTHVASRDLAKQVAETLGVAWERNAVWSALETDDVFAGCLARLLLWTDPKSVPKRGDVEGAYKTYEWNWRPGKPHKKDWPANYQKAVQAVIGAQG